MEEYVDEVVSELIKFIEDGESAIERGGDSFNHYIDESKVKDINTKLLDLFSSDEKVFTSGVDQWEEMWGHYYIFLSNNRLLTIAYNNCGKVDKKPTKFWFGLYPEGNKCSVSFCPHPATYSGFYQIHDSKGRDIDDENYAPGIVCLYQSVYFYGIRKPISLEEIKKRASGLEINRKIELKEKYIIKDKSQRIEKQVQIIEGFANLWEKKQQETKRSKIFALFEKYISIIVAANTYTDDCDLNVVLLNAINNRIIARGGNCGDNINYFLLRSIELIKGSVDYQRTRSR